MNRLSSAFLFGLLVLPSLAQAQTDSGSTLQGNVVLLKSLRALAPAANIRDVTLYGAGQKITGPEDEAGTVIVKASAGVGTRIDLSLPSGKQSDVRTTSSSGRTGRWSGQDGVVHPISQHNLLTDLGFFPQYALSFFVSSSNGAVEYIGSEIHNGMPVVHLAAYLKAPAELAGIDAWMRRLSRTEIFLDQTTFLPAAITFNAHPDDDDLVDIPVEVTFSDYRTIDGACIPFHVQKFLNFSLALDLHIERAVLNSGLSASDFDQR